MRAAACCRQRQCMSRRTWLHQLSIRTATKPPIQPSIVLRNEEQELEKSAKGVVCGAGQR